MVFQYDKQMIHRTIEVLQIAGSVVELRVPNTKQGIISAYFDDTDRMVQAAVSISGKAPGVFFTLNPVRRDLLARAANKLKPYSKHTTRDEEIERRQWFLIDLDPVRPAGISSTDDEHEAALRRARKCADWLLSQGWPKPVLADSGNGSHLLYLVNLPNDRSSCDLTRRCLEALAFQFSDAVVDVDRGTYNAARLCKIYGTLSAKGDSTNERPHRLSKLLDVPERMEVVERKLLGQLADSLPKPSKTVPSRQMQFDLPSWIAKTNLEVAREGPWNGGYRWILKFCPWNADHKYSAYLVQLANGAIAAGCHHRSCEDKGWHDLRDVYEPDWRNQAGRNSSDSAQNRAKGATSAGGRSFSRKQAPVDRPTWPDAPDPAAFHGLPGDIVGTIEPHSESDPVALLVQLLVAFGNVIGRSAYFPVEADRHSMNLFSCLVGRSSKGRKGTSQARILRLFETADPDWAAGRVKSGLSSGEGLIWEVRDKIEKQQPIKRGGKVTGYQTVIVDHGIPDKRLLITETEFASPLRIMGRDGNILSPLIRQAWDTGNLRTLTKNNPAQATGAHISIIGHITRDELLRHLDSTEVGNGFANRFLWVCVQRSKFLPEGGSLDEVDFAPTIRRLAEAIVFSRKVCAIQRDEVARSIWKEVYQELSEGKSGLLGAVVSRAEAQVTRLSCIYALLDCSPMVQKDHLLAAIALWEYCEASAAFIFGNRLGDPMADEIRKALLSTPQGLTRTDISALFRRNRSGSEISRALGVLLENGLAEWCWEETDGRKAERWFARNGNESNRSDEQKSARPTTNSSNSSISYEAKN